jgi:hypothetical protein
MFIENGWILHNLQPKGAGYFDLISVVPTNAFSA